MARFGRTLRLGASGLKLLGLGRGVHFQLQTPLRLCILVILRNSPRMRPLEDWMFNICACELGQV